MLCSVHTCKINAGEVEECFTQTCKSDAVEAKGSTSKELLSRWIASWSSHRVADLAASEAATALLTSDSVCSARSRSACQQLILVSIPSQWAELRNNSKEMCAIHHTNGDLREARQIFSNSARLHKCCMFASKQASHSHACKASPWPP